jgi:hypothetical protein
MLIWLLLLASLATIFYPFKSISYQCSKEDNEAIDILRIVSISFCVVKSFERSISLHNKEAHLYRQVDE